MDISPWILGACAAAVGGAVSGTAIETNPIYNRNDIIAELPSHETPQLWDEAATRESLPNHYALETPEGRIEVAELSMHGLYRNKRFASSRQMEPEPLDHLATDHAGRPNYAQAEELSSARPSAEPATSGADAPARIAEDVQPIEPLVISRPVEIESGPRIVNVSAEMAATN